MKKILVKNLELFSKRKNSTVYISADRKWIYKFVSDSTNANKINDYNENIEKTKYLISIGVSTPNVGEIVEDENGNIGLEYQNIENKVSFSRAVANNPEKIEEYMKYLALIGKSIHSIKCESDNIVKFSELIEKDLIFRKEMYSKNRIDAIHRLLNTVEDTNTLLHLDFQPGNYIMSDSGDYMIDLTTICKGNYIFDLGTFYYLYHNISEEGTKQLSRCKKELSEKMWRYFVKHYFWYKTEKEIDDFSEYIKPYAILSAIALDIFVPMEHVRKYIDENFEKVLYKYI